MCRQQFAQAPRRRARGGPAITGGSGAASAGVGVPARLEPPRQPTTWLRRERGCGSLCPRAESGRHVLAQQQSATTTTRHRPRLNRRQHRPQRQQRRAGAAPPGRGAPRAPAAARAWAHIRPNPAPAHAYTHAAACRPTLDRQPALDDVAVQLPDPAEQGDSAVPPGAADGGDGGGPPQADACQGADHLRPVHRAPPRREARRDGAAGVQGDPGARVPRAARGVGADGQLPQRLVRWPAASLAPPPRAPRRLANA